MADRDVGGRGRAAGIALPVVVLAAFALLVGLGTWQLDRLQWKQALIADRTAAIEAPPVDIEQPADGAPLPDFRHVRARGTFRHDKELLVGPRSQAGTAGWRVVTPLALAGGGYVLVDRGFVPEALKHPDRRAAGQVTGPVTVEGLLRRPSEGGVFAPGNDPEKGLWLRILPGEMARALGLSDMAPFWISAGPSPNPGGWPVGGADAIMPRNDHLQYAITWYALAIALVVVYVAYRRRERRGG